MKAGPWESRVTLARIAPIGRPASISAIKALGSVGRAQGYIKRAEREGLIKRMEGAAEHGHFPPVYNIITNRGIDLLKSLSSR